MRTTLSTATEHEAIPIYQPRLIQHRTGLYLGPTQTYARTYTPSDGLDPNRIMPDRRPVETLIPLAYIIEYGRAKLIHFFLFPSLC